MSNVSQLRPLSEPADLPRENRLKLVFPLYLGANRLSGRIAGPFGALEEVHQRAGPGTGHLCTWATATLAATSTCAIRSIWTTCREAQKHGAEVRDLHLVNGIAKGGDGYRVSFNRIDANALVPGSASARIVVPIAGGCRGTSAVDLIIEGGAAVSVQSVNAARRRFGRSKPEPISTLRKAFGLRTTSCGSCIDSGWNRRPPGIGVQADHLYAA